MRKPLFFSVSRYDRQGQTQSQWQILLARHLFPLFEDIYSWSFRLGLQKWFKTGSISFYAWVLLPASTFLRMVCQVSMSVRTLNSLSPLISICSGGFGVHLALHELLCSCVFHAIEKDQQQYIHARYLNVLHHEDCWKMNLIYLDVRTG